MRIELSKFGTTLTSRQAGKEAFAAFLPILKDVNDSELVEVDFTDINTFAPSWGDEFLSQLHYKYGERLKLLRCDNPSVKATITILEQTNEIKFIVE